MSNASSDSNESSALDVRLIQWDILPYATHPEIMEIWGPRDAASLKRLIDHDGGIRDALLCARIRGQDGKPILFDGYTRLMVHFARQREGLTDTVPAYVVQEFDDLGEVLQRILLVQQARRNVTAMQVADAALKIKSMQGYDVALKNTGRPKAERRNSTLKPLPSAKVLANEFGVSDRMIRLVQQANAFLGQQDRNRMLAKPHDDNYLSPTQLAAKVEAHRREASKAARQKALDRRREKLANTQVASHPNVIAPDGLFTVDAIAGIKRIAPGTVDFVCTSIPYACDLAYDNCPAFDGDYENYLDTHVRGWLAALKPALTTGARVAINFDCTYRLLDKQKAGADAHRVPNQFNLWADISRIAQDELGYLFMGYRIWYKQTCSRAFANGSRGSEMPMMNPNTEFVLIFAKDSMRLEGESDITKKEYDRFALSHWYIVPERRKDLEDDAYHPCPYPEELVYRLIRMYCPRNGVVLDPYSGSGTTAFVAKALGRRYIGLDNSPLYNGENAAAKRLASLDGLTPTERIKQIERFVAESEHGMEKHIRRRGIHPNSDDDTAP